MISYICNYCGAVSPARVCGACEHLIPTTKSKGLAGSEYLRNRRICITETPYCVHCGHTGSTKNPLTAGHIIPRKRGGTHDLSNLQTECRSCNSSKGTAPPTFA